MEVWSNAPEGNMESVLMGGIGTAVLVSAADGPLPFGDVVGVVILGGTVVYYVIKVTPQIIENIHGWYIYLAGATAAANQFETLEGVMEKGYQGERIKGAGFTFNCGLREREPEFFGRGGYISINRVGCPKPGDTQGLVNTLKQLRDAAAKMKRDNPTLKFSPEFFEGLEMWINLLESVL